MDLQFRSLLEALAVGVMLLGTSSPRAAAQQSAPLVLEAPCTTPSELEARVQPLLPGSLLAAAVLQGVQVRVRPSGAEHEVEISLPAHDDHPATTRNLRGETCQTVVDATILVIGLWVSESFPVAPPAPTPPPPAPSPPPPTGDHESEPVQRIVMLGGAVSHAMLPRTAFGVELGGALSYRTLRVSLGARYWPAAAEAGSSARVEASLIEGELVVSWLPLALGSVELGPAVGLAVGRLHVAGLAVDDPQERTLTWLRSELAVHARFILRGTPFALWARGGGAFSWSQPRVQVGGAGTVFRPAALSPYASLGLELVFD